MKVSMKKILLIGGVLLSMQAHAISIDWTGGYRIEYVDINRPTLSEPAEKKNYALHYLYLQPKLPLLMASISSVVLMF